MYLYSTICLHTKLAPFNAYFTSGHNSYVQNIMVSATKLVIIFVVYKLNAYFLYYILQKNTSKTYFTR